MANSKPAVLSSAAPCSPPALAAQRWGWLEHGLPKVEHDECRRLMVKAIMAGESEKIMDEALTEFRGLRSRLQLNGEWNHVLTFYGRGPGPETRKRVLEAQSSRALVEHTMDEEPSDGWAKISLEEDDVDSQDFDELFASPSPTRFDEVLENDVSSGNRKQRAKPKPSPEGLPPDVKNLTEWGSTIIQFGKFRNSNLTYEELALSDTKETNSYKVWVVSHIGQTTGQCQDLGQFLKAYTAAGFGSKQSVIPGTTQVRKFKASSSASSSGYKHVAPTTPRTR